MSYEPTYTRPYEGGYKNRPSEETPEMAEFINKRDDTLLKIEAFLKDLDLSGLGSEYALLSEAGYSLDVSMDNYYVLTISLKNKAGDVLSSKKVDLPIESMIIDVDYADGVLTLTLQNGNTVEVSIIDIVSGLVPETRTIAGIDLKDDITVAELKSALGIKPGGSSDAGTLDVTDKITPNPDLTFYSLTYKSIQIGNAVFLTFEFDLTGGASVGTMYDVFYIDESIIPNANYSNIVWGTGNNKGATIVTGAKGAIQYDGGTWGAGSIQWFTDASTTEIDKTTGGELKPWLYDTSGEEVIYGVYGGKPLYQKILVYENVSVGGEASLNINLGLENIDKIFIDNIHAIDNGALVQIPYVHYEGSNTIGAFLTNNYQLLNLRFGSSNYNKIYQSITVILRYTKTTDAEGSGNSLTPYGVFNAKLDGIEEDIDAILADSKTTLITTTYTDIKSEGKYYLGLDCVDKPSNNACFVLTLEHPTISGYLGLFVLDVITNTLYTNTYQSTSGWSGWDDYVKKSEVADLMVVSSVDVTPDSLIESITFRRRGNVGQIVFGKLISEVEIGTTVTIGTIPEGYIPMAGQMGVIPVTVGTSHCSMYVGASSSGTLSVRFMQDIPVNTQLYGLFTYMI